MPGLSERVLLEAATLVPGGDSEQTADALYHGNWLPLAPSWLRRFTDEAAVASFVVGKVDTGGWLRNVDPSWVHWRAMRGGRQLAAPFKVYVSVVPDELPLAFAASIEVFATQRTRSFKLSRYPRGLLRPDRLVAYCVSAAETRRLVGALAQALGGYGVHGVPFTAATPGNPAVSWARDPAGHVAGYAPSWRRWVARKLAGYLHASDAPDAAGRAAFATARLDADGVDTTAWAPRPELWPT